jgi:hypothetical protein
MATNIGKATLSMRDVAAQQTIKVTLQGLKEFKFRLWLGFFVIKLGTKITGLRFKLNNE